MFSWIAENVAAFIVVIAVAALLALAVAALLRDKKKGRHACGCDCAHCKYCDACKKSTGK